MSKKTYSPVQFEGFCTLAQYAQCYGVQYQYVRRLEKQYRRLYTDLVKRRNELYARTKVDIMGPSVFSYKCTDERGVNREFLIPRWAVRLMTIALNKCKPVPMDSARHEMVHGKREYSGAYVQCHQDYITFTVHLLTPLIRLRIQSEEFRIRGRSVRVYAGSRQVGHRGTERLFGESDVEDIIDKAILTVFCPLIARTIPIRGIGHGVCVMERCTVEMYNCTREERCTLHYKTYDHKVGAIHSNSVYGWMLKFTDSMTGEVVRAFTDSPSRCEYLMSLTGCTGVIAEQFVATDVNGEILDTTNPVMYECTEPIDFPEFIADSIGPYNSERAFNSVLVGTIRQHYRVLNRRSDHEDALISEHKKNRDKRTVDKKELPLYELLKNKVATVDCTGVTDILDELIDSEQMTTDQAAVCEVELMTGEELRLLYGHIHPAHHRQYAAFMDARTVGGAEDREWTPGQYWRFRRQFLAKLRHDAKMLDERPAKVKRTPVPLVRIVRQLPLWKRERKLDKRTAYEVLNDAVNLYGVNRSVPKYSVSDKPAARESYWMADRNGELMYIPAHHPPQVYKETVGGYYRPLDYGTPEVITEPVYTGEKVSVPSAVRGFTGHVFTSEVMVNALVKRTDEELHELQNNERVRKYSEYKTVQVAVPCWESTSGQMYIEQNHDDC